jgi:hypothetical protein
MHALSLPLGLPRPKLSSVDSPLCHETAVEGRNIWYERWRHRQKCHKQTFAVYEQLSENEKVRTKITGEGRCRTSDFTDHCECFVLPLHKRLRGWVPRHLRYCAYCKRFTKRLKRDNMRCEYQFHVTFRGLGLLWVDMIE